MFKLPGLIPDSQSKPAGCRNDMGAEPDAGYPLPRHNFESCGSRICREISAAILSADARFRDPLIQLPYKASEVAVLEVLGKYIFREIVSLLKLLAFTNSINSERPYRTSTTIKLSPASLHLTISLCDGSSSILEK